MSQRVGGGLASSGCAVLDMAFVAARRAFPMFTVLASPLGSISDESLSLARGDVAGTALARRRFSDMEGHTQPPAACGRGGSKWSHYLLTCSPTYLLV